MSKKDCEFPYRSYEIFPYRIFISHSKKDHDISQIIADALKNEEKIDTYIAERDSIGIPLMSKLRDELIDSDAILVLWTENANEQPACEIIGFETGMAWANHLNIFVIKDASAKKKIKITWFYEQLTDYIEMDFDQIRSDRSRARKIIGKLNFETYLDPICFTFPRKDNAKKNSRNEECVADDGSINLKSPFDDILYFNFGNHTNRIIRDIRITIKFPPQISIIFDEGDSGFSIKREIFWMRAISSNEVRLAWPVLPSEEHWAPELRL